MDEVQCMHCSRCLTSGHVCCQCGRTVTRANPVIEDQEKRFVKQQFEFQTQSALPTVKGTRNCGTSQEQQDRGKTKEVLGNAKKAKLCIYFRKDG